MSEGQFGPFSRPRCVYSRHHVCRTWLACINFLVCFQNVSHAWRFIPCHDPTHSIQHHTSTLESTIALHPFIIACDVSEFVHIWIRSWRLGFCDVDFAVSPCYHAQIAISRILTWTRSSHRAVVLVITFNNCFECTCSILRMLIISRPRFLWCWNYWWKTLSNRLVSLCLLILQVQHLTFLPQSHFTSHGQYHHETRHTDWQHFQLILLHGGCRKTWYNLK